MARRLAKRGFRIRRGPKEVPEGGFEGGHWKQAVEAIAQSSFTSNDTFRILKEGKTAFDALFEGIERAERRIALEFYIFRDDETGWALADLLSRKAHQGVKVYLIYDHFGSRGTSVRFWRFLRDSGVMVRAFRPWEWRRPGRYLHRDHRKLVIIDGKAAFTGGFNIGDEYRGYWRKKIAGWRDTGACMEGPIAAAMWGPFERSWRECGGAKIGRGWMEQAPPAAERGDGLQMIPLFSSSRASMRALQRVLHWSILSARKSIYITVAYFIPPRRILQLLSRAARRGVEVKLILPGESDLKFTSLASRVFYPRLLQEGVELFHYRPGILHAKTMVFDGCWAILGSANLDARSFHYNYECGVGILDRGVGGEMTRMFQEDLKESVAVTAEETHRYPLWERAVGRMLLRFRSHL
ncbi:MAG: phospholipase D-like domain-containing protein [candidate division NC10 bacterium]|nr:phospholipase D-like domain-containing protein [candidate division NC10 bacterium]